MRKTWNLPRNLKQLLLDNPELAEEIEEKIKAKIFEKENPIVDIPLPEEEVKSKATAKEAKPEELN